MTDINHRRKNRKPVNQRYPDNAYHNGYPAHGGIRGNNQRVGKTDYLDKSMHGWGRISLLADGLFGAGIGNDYTDGHRGMAHQVRGAKKFSRTRFRFHENAATRKLGREHEEGE